MKTVDHIDVGATHGIKWPRLVLAIFEVPLLLRAEGVRKLSADVSPELISRVTDSVYLSEEEQTALARLVKRGVEVEIQTFPREALRLEIDEDGGSSWSKR